MRVNMVNWNPVEVGGLDSGSAVAIGVDGGDLEPSAAFSFESS